MVLEGLGGSMVKNYMVFTVTTRSGYTHIEPSCLKFFEGEVPSDYILRDDEYVLELSQYVEAYPSFFKVESLDLPHNINRGEDTLVVHPLLYSGYSNYPVHTINMDKFEAGEFPLEHFDPTQVEYFSDAKRRRKITDSLQGTIPIFTEIKKIRKAIKAIVEYIPELKSDDRIVEFISYSDYIESQIGQVSKDKFKGKLKIKIDQEDINA